jgi:ABC-type multidrug transport system fused ATPase/permease subunit
MEECLIEGPRAQGGDKKKPSSKFGEGGGSSSPSDGDDFGASLQDPQQGSSLQHPLLAGAGVQRDISAADILSIGGISGTGGVLIRQPGYNRYLEMPDTVASGVRSVALQIVDADFRWDDRPQEQEAKRRTCWQILQSTFCCQTLTPTATTAAKNGNTESAAKGAGKGANGKLRNDAAVPLLDPTDGKEEEEEEEVASPDSNAPTLEGINFSVQQGELVCLVGSVGAGKSSLLSALLNEIPIVERTADTGRVGSVSVAGTIAYCEQKPWVQSASLRENILFGLPMDEARYERTIKCCSLEHDLEMLANGDETEIGERGLNLSGGQQARVSLARAVYSNADIMLLDDVLSAVDVHVCAHLLRECILNPDSIGTKTRVIATHQLHWLRYADRVFVLEEGKISAVGTFDELVKNGVMEEPQESEQKEPKLVLEEGGAGSEGSTSGAERAEMAAASQIPPPGSTATSQPTAADSATSTVVDGVPDKKVAQSAPLQGSDAIDAKKDKGATKLTAGEDRERGVVQYKIWLEYVKQLTPLRFVPVVLLVVLRAGFQVAGDMSLTYWTQAVKDRQGHTHSTNINTTDITTVSSTIGSSGSLPDAHYLFLYGGLLLSCGVFVYFRAIAMAYASFAASVSLHNEALWAVLRSPMAYFDSTPTGRIVNRFSLDLQRFDMQLSSGVQNLLYQVRRLLYQVRRLLRRLLYQGFILHTHAVHSYCIRGSYCTLMLCTHTVPGVRPGVRIWGDRLQQPARGSDDSAVFGGVPILHQPVPQHCAGDTTHAVDCTVPYLPKFQPGTRGALNYPKLSQQ